MRSKRNKKRKKRKMRKRRIISSNNWRKKERGRRKGIGR